jgi:hypothetical protein
MCRFHGHASFEISVAERLGVTERWALRRAGEARETVQNQESG